MAFNSKLRLEKRIAKIERAEDAAIKLAVNAGYTESEARDMAADARENTFDVKLFEAPNVLISTMEMFIDCGEGMPSSVKWRRQTR